MVTRGHVFSIEPETATLGKLRNIVVDKETKRADCEAWLVEKRLTGKEVEALEKGEHVRGSLAYNSRKIYLPEPMVWPDGSVYDAEVKRPFRAHHYALLDEADEPACPTCGFNIPKESLESHMNECKLSKFQRNEYMTTDPEPGKGSKTEPASASEARVSKEEFEALKATLAAEKAAREKAEAEAKAESEKAIKEANERAKAAEERAIKLENEARLKLHIEAAKTDYEAIHNPAELGAILMDIETKAPESYAKLTPILKAANERIKTGALFETKGSNGIGTANTAWEKIEAAAKEKMSKDPKLSMASAIDIVCREHADWYDEYRKEVM